MWFMWLFCRDAQFPKIFGRIARNCGNSAFPQSFDNRILGEITLFYAVKVILNSGYKILLLGINKLLKPSWQLAWAEST